MRTTKVSDILDLNAEFERSFYHAYFWKGKKEADKIFKLWKKFQKHKVNEE